MHYITFDNTSCTYSTMLSCWLNYYSFISFVSSDFYARTPDLCPDNKRMLMQRPTNQMPAFLFRPITAELVKIQPMGDEMAATSWPMALKCKPKLEVPRSATMFKMFRVCYANREFKMFFACARSRLLCVQEILTNFTL